MANLMIMWPFMHDFIIWGTIAKYTAKFAKYHFFFRCMDKVKTSVSQKLKADKHLGGKQMTKDIIACDGVY